MKEEIKILSPTSCESSYSIAAKEFQRLYREITGITLPIVTEDDTQSDLITIGSDTVNNYVANLILENKVEGFKLRVGTDDYNIRSVKPEGRNILLIAGGRGRSTLYAVYDFFERSAGCRYFWDGDIIPSADKIDLTGLDIIERPRFEYRGLRYFAHRGLHRFQAEHWSYEDWCKEIDWILKKRLNLLMLRIGIDDLFQRAFPDLVDYPSMDDMMTQAEYGANFQSQSGRYKRGGYYDRRLFWPLKYRGELRKKILSYAFERDLIHPEDCGTLTHWYSQTPQQFLEKVKPKLIEQPEYKATESVWDVRQDGNLKNYYKLTETHIKEYGHPEPELFHTIGFAERRYPKSKGDNLEHKLYMYRRMSNYLVEKHPTSSLLIAGWDLWKFDSVEDVQRLVSEIDPKRTLIFDYTSDTVRFCNFTNWGVVGKFPWIFGIFHGFAPNSDIRGNYDLTEKRLEIAKADDFCKGLVFWPELSHSDTFMLEYFTVNAWAPLSLTIEERIKKYCNDRYPMSHSNDMIDIWNHFMPVIKLMSWSMDEILRMPKEYFFDIFYFMKFEAEDFNGNEELVEARKYLKDAIYVLEKLSLLAKDDVDDKFLYRDIFDIARTVCGRYIHFGLRSIEKLVYLWQKNKDTGLLIYEMFEVCLRLMELLSELLGGHSDYSLYNTLQGLNEVHEVYPFFEETLKNNATCQYCRSYIYENARFLYLPEMKLLFAWIQQNIEEKNLKLIYREEYLQKVEENNDLFKCTPLADMVPRIIVKEFFKVTTDTLIFYNFCFLGSTV